MALDSSGQYVATGEAGLRARILVWSAVTMEVVASLKGTIPKPPALIGATDRSCKSSMPRGMPDAILDVANSDLWVRWHAPFAAAHTHTTRAAIQRVK